MFPRWNRQVKIDCPRRGGTAIWIAEGSEIFSAGVSGLVKKTLACTVCPKRKCIILQCQLFEDHMLSIKKQMSMHVSNKNNSTHYNITVFDRSPDVLILALMFILHSTVYSLCNHYENMSMQYTAIFHHSKN